MANFSMPNEMNLSCSNVLLDAVSRRILKDMIYDECHLREQFLVEIGWASIHASNSGELDDELDFLEEYAAREKITSLLITSPFEIIKSRRKILRGIRLSEINAKIMRDIQNGFWFFLEHDKSQINNESGAPAISSNDLDLLRNIAFGSSLMFSEPLRFVILREHDGYGWTSISGMPEFIEELKTRSRHAIYEWKEGTLPPDIPGGRKP